jgi:hypothetical protein
MGRRESIKRIPERDGDEFRLKFFTETQKPHGIHCHVVVSKDLSMPFLTESFGSLINSS